MTTKLDIAPQHQQRFRELHVMCIAGVAQAIPDVLLLKGTEPHSSERILREAPSVTEDLAHAAALLALAALRNEIASGLLPAGETGPARY